MSRNRRVLSPSPEPAPGAPQSWIEIAVEADREAVEIVAEVLRGYGTGAVIDEPFLQPRLEDPPIPDPSRRPVVKTYVPDDERASSTCRAIEEVLWHIGQLRTVGPMQVKTVAEEDWANVWKAYYPVQMVGRRIVVVPAWRRHRRRGDQVVVRLDPGLAFGTGSHPTTRLCLEAAEALIRPGYSVLDVGTGSGILSIAAARLGASFVAAVDLDPLAVDAARGNVRLNRLSRIIAVREGSVAEAAAPPGDKPVFDVVLANVTARVNAFLAPTLVGALAPRGRLVASGILEENLDLVREAFSGVGLRFLTLMHEGDWVAVIARRTGSSRGPRGTAPGDPVNA